MANISSINGNPIVIKSINGNPIVLDASGIADNSIPDSKLAQTGGILETFDGFVSDVSTLIEPSNVFNVNDVTRGVLSQWGEHFDNTACAYTNYYIKVNAGDVVNSVYNMRAIAAYDADKNIVGASGVSSDTKSYTVPQGISYIRPTVYTSNQNNAICINRAATYTPWFEPYYRIELNSDSVGTTAIADKAVTPAKTSFLDLINRHDSSADEVGYYINPSSGALQPNSSYTTTGFIEVTAGETLHIIQPNENYGKGRFLVAFDANKVVVPSANISGDYFEYAVPDGVSYVRMTLYNTYTPETLCITTGEHYAPYGVYSLGDEVDISSKMSETQQPIVVMPAEVCVAVGRTVEIYNSQVCLNAERFHFRWQCNVGYQYGRKFQIVGTSQNVGSHTATLMLYDDSMNKVYTGTTTIKVVADNITSLRVCPIGDSLTNRKPWLSKVMELNSGIGFVGTRWGGNTKADSPYFHEGRSGATAGWYMSDSSYTFDSYGDTTTNPFWNPSAGSFDWNYYKQTYDIEPDAVQIFLGTNGLSLDNSGQVGNIMSMVSAIRAADASIPIYVVNTLYWGNQDGIAASQKSGATDGQTGNFRGYMSFELDMMVYDLATRLIDAVKELNDANVHLVPIAFTHDSEYNFGAVETPVNPYATQTEPLPSEAVHPQAQGYYQMADIIYSTLCAYEG